MGQRTRPASYCLKCRYSLDHLRSRRCPECGYPFDPDDPGTYGETTFAPQPWTVGFAWVLALYPLLIALMVYGTWTVAWLESGHRPRYGDSPLEGSDLILCLGMLTLGAVVWGFALAFIGLVATGFAIVTELYSRRWRRAVWIAALPLATWTALIVLFRIDPFEVVEWMLYVD